MVSILILLGVKIVPEDFQDKLSFVRKRYPISSKIGNIAG